MKGATFHPEMSKLTQEQYKDRKRNVYEDGTKWKLKSVM
jgi:hypothetical protein